MFIKSITLENQPTYVYLSQYDFVSIFQVCKNQNLSYILLHSLQISLLLIFFPFKLCIWTCNSFEAGNGIKAEEKGRQKELADGAGTVVEGSFSYPGPDGNLISITYTADENGFVPKGDHLPTPPPIPEQIRKALEQSGVDGTSGGVGGPGPGYPQPGT